MKKTGILNSDISRVLSYMGHTDTLCVGDCGLPIPETTERIDLAVTLGSPTFMAVLTEVASHMAVEKITLAEEIVEFNPGILAEIKGLFPAVQVVMVPHVDFKKQTADCKAVIRTGETSPYANIILQSACLF